MKCRICNVPDAQSIGRLMAYLDYRVEVFDCAVCGCRFTLRDDNIYERLHSNKNSTYGMHQRFAEAVKQFFDARDINQLEHALTIQAKNKHIIDAAKTLAPDAHVLEAGCSLGYLTSWFIGKGFSVTATDVSQTAIDKATALFGPHFCLINDANIEKNAPYDFIYHAGTIGCVDDPIGLTRYWLSLLKQGGRLVFNAPNRSLADQLGALWPYTTTPPDLVTLFSEQFWHSQFANVADVDTSVLHMTEHDALLFRHLPVFVMRAQPYLFKTSHLMRFLLRVINALARRGIALIGNVALPGNTSAPVLPTEFGVLVTLRKH